MLTKTPEMTDSAVLAMVLDDMEFLGLIRLKSDVDKPQAQQQGATSKEAAAWRCWSAECTAELPVTSKTLTECSAP
jgi:hypothetical protein